MKILLTSAGFENSAVGDRFIHLLPKPINQSKVLFIPTAATNDEAQYYARKCIDELKELGIIEGNITIYNFEYEMTEKQALEFNVLYFPGGDTSYLLSRIKERRFDCIIHAMIEANRVYVGVSAGSLIMTANISIDDPANAGLGYLKAFLAVHCNDLDNSWISSMNAKLPLPFVALSDKQALLVDENGYSMIQ
jgi:peptidase E